jgi:hypothetical protein
MALTGSSAAHFPPDGRLPGLGLAVVAILLITISPLALVSLGFSYDDAGGSALEKVHPGSIAAYLLLGLCALSVRNPLTGAINGLARHPGTFFFLVTIALLMLHAIRVVVLPFTSFFDTFVTPVVVFFLFKDLREERARRFVLLFHALMMLNSVLGIVEFATGWRLTPIVASGMVIEDEWRSSALLGHPLANASLTGSYILALALGAARDLPRPMAAIALVLSVCGMVVFGGRASSIFLLAMLLALGGLRFLHILRGGRFNTRNVLAVLISLPVLAAVVFGLLEGGFFDRFIERFVDDQGSASTRIEMFELFKHISFSELLLAPDAAQMATLRSLYGLDFGIESFWISFVLNYGLIPGLFFFAGLLAFCRDVVRSLRPGGTWVMVFFFAVASTSVSLSAKTPLFAVFILMLLVLMRKRQPPAVAQPLAPSQLRPARLHGTLRHA